MQDIISCWKTVPREKVISRILHAVPDVNVHTVSKMLDKYSDGVFYDFETKDWIKFFKEKMYL